MHSPGRMLAGAFVAIATLLAALGAPRAEAQPRARPGCGASMDGWSVDKAWTLLIEASALLASTPECNGTDNFLACRKVARLQHEAADQIAQVLARSRPPSPRCNFCKLSPTMVRAGARMDAIATGLRAKGYRSGPVANWRAHYASLAADPLCTGLVAPPSMHVVPVPSAAACAAHCRSVSDCHVAYYCRLKESCQWASGVTSVNRSSEARVYDRRSGTWIAGTGRPPCEPPRSVGPGPVGGQVKPPPGPVPPAALRGAGPRFAKTRETRDACGSRPDCLRWSKSASGSLYEVDYALSAGHGSIRTRETREHSRQVVTDFSVEFGFDTPPPTIRAGQTLELRVRGRAGGRAAGGHYSRSFVYYLDVPGRSRRYFNQSSQLVKFVNTELPVRGGVRQGNLPARTGVARITIPSQVRGDIVIGGRMGWEPAVFIEWVYKAP